MSVSRTTIVADVLKTRKQASLEELAKLIKDKEAAPINYNHYYTDNVYKKRGQRIEDQIKKYVPEGLTGSTAQCNLGTHVYGQQTDINEKLKQAMSEWGDNITADLEEFSCEEALDCLEAIYKVKCY